MIHASHPAITKRLRRVEGHLAATIKMLVDQRSCVDVAQQLQAIESAIASAKRELIQDHLDHCLEEAVAEGRMAPKEALAEVKALARYL